MAGFGFLLRSCVDMNDALITARPELTNLLRLCSGVLLG
jgi:hypothetical protein